MFDFSKATERKILLYDASADEIRRIMLIWEDDDSCSLVERSDGALTMTVFGTLSHAYRVHVSAEQLPLACEAFACRRNELGGVFERLFACPEAHLSDLQDLLDKSGVAYQVAVYNGKEIAIHMQDLWIE